MYYELNGDMKEVLLNKVNTGLLVGILTYEQLEKDNEQYFRFSKRTLQELGNMNRVRVFNKMDSYYGYCFGILHILKQASTNNMIQIGIYIKEKVIVIVCNDAHTRSDIKNVIKKISPTSYSLEHIVSSIMEQMIKGYHEIITRLEETIDRLDNRVMHNHIEKFNQSISKIRKDILLLTHYFEQLIDVCEELLEDENDFFQVESVHHLRILSDRVNRLAGNIRLLRDYMIQVRESYQSQVDINLNQIMYIFTVVTTIFLPLTLIVGWYGMNFTTMPEVQWKYGYVFVIVLSLLVIIFCIWYFKKKKFLRK